MNLLTNLSIKYKLMVVLVASITITALICCLVSILFLNSYTKSNFQTYYDDVAKEMALTTEEFIDFGMSPDRIERIESYHVHKALEFFQMYNAEGKQFYSHIFNSSRDFNPPETLQPKNTNQYQGDYLIITKPIIRGDQIVGSLYLEISTEEHFNNKVKYIAIIVGLIIVLTILLIFCLVLPIANSLSKPITNLTEHISKANTQNLYTLNIDLPNNKDEISDLYREFDKMTKLIAETETERQKAEMQEKSTNEIFTKASISAFDALIITDENLKIKSLNPAAEKLSGYRNDEVIGMSALTLLVPKDKIADVEAAVQKQRETGTCKYTEAPFEGECLTKNGGSFMAEVSVTAYRTETVRGCAFTIRDITTRKQYEKDILEAKQKAEESDKLKSAFLANMSHEIRTPMNSIIGFSELLAKTGGLTGTKAKYLDLIVSSGKSLLNLINDIIDISKIEAGQLKIKPKKAALNPMMNEIYISQYQINNIKEKGIEFVMKNSVESDEFLIETDPFRFKQIINNLITNAMKFTDKGFIEFGYKFNTPQELLFYVKDTGSGMPADKLNVIFERFGQIEQSGDRNQQGTGLGLAISKKLVELLGGKMWVESAEGQGSTFYFTLPYDSELNIADEYGASNDNENFEKTLNGKKIIVAEDEEMNRMFMREVLFDTGAQIIWAENGQQAVDFARQNPDTDIILMDIKMPIKNGYDATKEIRTFNNDVVIIAQTAYALSDEKEKAISAGCNYYLTKPIDISLLMKVINGFLKKNK